MGVVQPRFPRIGFIFGDIPLSSRFGGGFGLILY